MTPHLESLPYAHHSNQGKTTGDLMDYISRPYPYDDTNRT